MRNSVSSLVHPLSGLWTSPPRSCLCFLFLSSVQFSCFLNPHGVVWPQTPLAHSQRSPDLQLFSFCPWYERELFLPNLYSFPAAFRQHLIKGQQMTHHRDLGQIFFGKGNPGEIWPGVKSWDQRNVWSIGGDRAEADTAEWVNCLISFFCVIHLFSINVRETLVAAAVIKSKQINAVLWKLVINITNTKDPIFLTALINLVEGILGHILSLLVVRNQEPLGPFPSCYLKHQRWGEQGS